MTLISMSFELKQVLYMSEHKKFNKQNFTDCTCSTCHPNMHFLNEGNAHVSIPRGLFSTITMAELA